MSQLPLFKKLRDLDSAVEKEIGFYLDSHFYDFCFDNYFRISDCNQQMQGVDTIVSSNKLSIYSAEVDEKSASHYVNTGLSTFAFELSYLSEGIVTDGWFLDANKLTKYYLLIWPSAKRDAILEYCFDNKYYPYFRCQDITRLEYVFVSRERVLRFLSEKSYSEEWLRITNNKIRKEGNNWLNGGFNEKCKRKYGISFFYSDTLAERPVNILVRKADLKKIAILSGAV